MIFIPPKNDTPRETFLKLVDRATHHRSSLTKLIEEYTEAREFLSLLASNYKGWEYFDNFLGGRG